MKHIGSKLFLGFVSMALLTIIVLWTVQAGFMRNMYQQERIKAVQSAISQFAGSSETEYEALAETMNLSLIAVDSSGGVRYRSSALPMMGMMLRNVQAMIPDGADGQPKYMTGMNNATRYVLLGRKMPSGVYVFAIFSLADLDEAARLVREQLWLITLILVALSIGMAVFLSSRLSRPIRAVTGAARELAAGNLAVRLPVRTKDEIGQLTTALNELGIELGRTEELRRELIANVSHELRAPLSVIQGYAEIVRDVSWPDEKKRTDQLNIIADESSRLTRIVKDILDYSRLQAGVERPALQDMPICPALDLLRTRYEIEARRHQVEIKTYCRKETIRFDRDRFDQVMHNLLNNAINHARPDSIVEIRVSESDQARGKQKICRIEISNAGEQIPSADLPKIWERYYRADRMVQRDAGSAGRPLGTGLGLAIVRSICELHGVAYGVRSDPERTVFWFEAPLAADPG